MVSWVVSFFRRCSGKAKYCVDFRIVWLSMSLANVLLLALGLTGVGLNFNWRSFILDLRAMCPINVLRAGLAFVTLKEPDLKSLSLLPDVFYGN